MRRRSWFIVTIGLLSAGSSGGQEARPDVRWQVAGTGHGTPAADAMRAFFLTAHHEVVAVDRRTGHIAWRSATGASGERTQGARVVLGGSRVVAGDGALVAFEAGTGAVAWRFSPTHAGAPGLYLGSASATTVLAGSTTGHVHAVDPATGQPLWSTWLGRDRVVFAPVAIADRVAVSFTDFADRPVGGIAMLALATGQVLWEHRLPAWRGLAGGSGTAGLPLATDTLVLVPSHEGVIYAFARSDGRLEWVLPRSPSSPDGAPGGAHDFRPLARAGDLLVAGSLTGEVSAIDLTTRRLRWAVTPVEASVAFGLVADETTVYVPYLSGHLVALDARTGREAWRIGGAAEGFGWAPSIAGDAMFAAGSGGGFLALAHPPRGGAQR